MEIKSLKCNNCSADLQINPAIKFFNCTFCGSSLTIKESGNVMYTEVLEDIKENTETLLDNSEIIVAEKAIARLDREWLMEREQEQVDTKDESNYPEDESANARSILISGVAFVAFYIFVVGFVSTDMPNRLGGAKAGVFFITFALFFIILFTIGISSKQENKSP